MVDPFSSVGIYRCDALEDYRLGRERGFLDPVRPAMDRLRTRKKKYYSNWILGMQPPWQHFGIKLLCYLSPGFGWGDHDLGAAASLRQESLPEMARGTDGQEDRKGRCP